MRVDAGNDLPQSGGKEADAYGWPLVLRGDAFVDA